MKKLALLTASLFVLGTLGGCMLRLGSAGASYDSGQQGISSGGGTPQCHPSQYWDGSQCRHKGKGKGARKHDG